MGVAAVAAACGATPTESTAVTSVGVTSPIGNRLGVGRTAQLSGVPRDARGNQVNASITWSSSVPTVATVSPAGLVSGLAAGTSSIRAEVQSVQGSVDLVVKAADFPAITDVVNDPFTLALIANLSSGVRTRVQAAMALCTNGVGTGNFTTIEACFAMARAEIAGASDPTDMALLATLALFVDHAERRLNG